MWIFFEKYILSPTSMQRVINVYKIVCTETSNKIKILRHNITFTNQKLYHFYELYKIC